MSGDDVATVTGREGCPAHVPPSSVHVFDYQADPRATPTPFDAYMALRDHSNFWSPVSGGFFVLTDAASIRDAYQDGVVFSSRTTGLNYTTFAAKMIPLQLDPPVHALYRRLLASAFSPAAANRLVPAIHQICADLLPRFASRGSADVIAEFAGPLPRIIFLQHLLKLPLEEMGTFLAWADGMLRQEDPALTKRSGDALWAYLRELIPARRRNPVEGDVLSEIIAGTVDGRAVTTDEAINIASLLFIAGLDTVTTALAFSLHFLAGHPQHRRQLVENPLLVESAVEELLRVHAFVNPVRTCTKDMEFHGLTLRAGDRVLLPAALAGRDDREFADAAEVRFDRASNRHLAFGAGPHRCLGSHLARKQLQIALTAFHEVLPEYELDESLPITFHAGGVMGMDRVPLRWTAPAPASA
ncbi:cytochrome P450 [Pseudonocardia sp. GCM10023141]|uniref:cytochrome P450 n=1 Tax=Pseudonocardia sp. GCM10023141 TaxID=3252653 RepID=UPI003611E6D1